MTKVLRASYLAPQQCVYRTLVPARSCARLEKDEATGAMMASVHDASVSHAATVSFASAANDAAGLSVCQVATARCSQRSKVPGAEQFGIARNSSGS